MRCAASSLTAARSLSLCLRPGLRLWRVSARAAPALPPVRCSSSASSNDNGSGGGGGGSEDGSQSSDSVYKGFAARGQQQQKPQQKQQQPPTAADALQNTLAGLSANVGRVPAGNNVILDTTTDEDKWRELDMQVNEYPGQRTFKAIGTGDQDFVDAMTKCVEDVVGKVHQECINHRASSQGKYVSVTVGPVWVENPDQMLAIYESMKQDGRLRFFF